MFNLVLFILNKIKIALIKFSKMLNNVPQHVQQYSTMF
jgi:hypothetical protein